MCSGDASDVRSATAPWFSRSPRFLTSDCVSAWRSGASRPCSSFEAFEGTSSCSAVRIMNIGPISCSRMHPRIIPSLRPGVGVEGPDGSSRRSTLLSRSTMREPLPLSTPAVVVKSAPSAGVFCWTEHTFRTDFWGQVCSDVERPYGDMGGNPKRC